MNANVANFPDPLQGISVLEVHPVTRSDLKTAAFVDIQVGPYRVSGLAVVRHAGGAFVSLPKRKNGQKWYEIIQIAEPLRSEVFKTVLAEPRVRELLR